MERARHDEEIKRLKAEIAEAPHTDRPTVAASQSTVPIVHSYNTRRSARSTLRVNRESLEEAYSPTHKWLREW